MSEGILFIFEGKKQEPKIYRNMCSLFFENNNENNLHIYTSFKTVIYKLWKEINEIGFIDDINIVDLLKDYCEECKKDLEGVSYRDISQVYLFFDHDGHASNASDENLMEMLDYFDDEFDKGKLFINYPMTESLQDVLSETPYKEKVCSISENRNYKVLVKKMMTPPYGHIGRLDESNWGCLLEKNAYKANYIITGEYLKPKKLHSQINIFEQQLVKHINPKKEVSILNGFPLFLIDYFGLSLIKE
jgi:hypothetical protein